MANGAQALLGGAYLLVLGRALGPTEFGVFSVVTALISVAGLLLEMRIQDVVARDLCNVTVGDDPSGQDGSKLIDLFVLEAVGRSVSVIGLVMLAPSLARLSNLPPDAHWLIGLAAAGFLLSKTGTGVSTGLLRVLGRTDLIAACMSADWGLRLLLTILLALLGTLSIINALWVALAVGGICNAAQVLLAAGEFEKRVARLSPAKWSLFTAVDRLRHDGRLIAANLGVSASDLMAKDLDVAMISSFMAADKVGLYKMAKSLVQVIWRAIDPFYLAIMPEVQRLWTAREFVALKRLLAKTSRRLLVLSVALVAVGCALVWLFGNRVLGAGYEQMPSLMLLMSVWVIFCAPFVWGHPLAVAINRPELAVAGSLLGSVSGVAAFLTLTPRFGLTGAACAWVITLLTGFFFTAGSALLLAKPRLEANP